MKRATPIKLTILLTFLFVVFSQIAAAADAPIWTFPGAKW